MEGLVVSDVVVGLSLAFTILALAPAYYSLILFVSSMRYPRRLGEDSGVHLFPVVSILIAVFNEKFVIGRTLDALRLLDYPAEKIHVVVADDSNDETQEVVDRKIHELNKFGIKSTVSRRNSREGFKSGALNRAAPLLRGEYTLLLDADSVVTPDVLKAGVSMFQRWPDVAFVSFRVGHYNREQNLTTRLFALSLDLGDALNKMGSYSINSPFSFQGGFTLISNDTIKNVGFWSNDSVVDDADLSCRVYVSGMRGVYLSSVSIFSEDPPVLEVWKKQYARVAQGWAKCVRSNWRRILSCKKLSWWRRVGLLLMLMSPFSALSWIVVTFMSAFAIVLEPTAMSVFSNPVYVVLVSLPVVSYFAAAIYSLHVQRILNARNLLLIPLISYSGYGMLAAGAVGFVNGIRGKTGFFFRTPKSGPVTSLEGTDYFRAIRFDRKTLVEGFLSLAALIMSIPVLLRGASFLGLSLMGFGALTLKSMNLSRLLKARSYIREDLAKRVPC